MPIRSAFTGITTLTCPKDLGDLDTENEVLARWLELADKALEIHSHGRQHQRVHHARFGRRNRRHKINGRFGPVRHIKR